MNRSMNVLAGLGWIAAAAAFSPVNAQVVAQNAPPTDQAGRTAPAGTDVAPPSSAALDGGRRPPTDATGQTAPAGSPVAPSRLADPSTATPSMPSTTRP